MPASRTDQYRFPSGFPDPEPLGGTVVSLALQGGASLGAYTWGVLDALTEDGRLQIEGVTGSSAGAINAVAYGVGFATGGRDGARDRLRAFWEGLAYAADSRRRGRFDFVKALIKAAPNIRSSSAFYSLTTRLMTDFRMDPDTIEPLRGTLAATLDFAALDEDAPVKVFVNVTDVQTGQPEVFAGADIDANIVCASCAVPFLFAPVEVHGRFYWDGGLLGNPAIYPVIYGCATRDVILVETDRMQTDSVPRTAADVMSRTLELAARAGLVRELRTIRFVSQLLREAPRDGMREIRLHRLRAHSALSSMEGRRGFRADVPYFHKLRDLGREAARNWLAESLPS